MYSHPSHGLWLSKIQARAMSQPKPSLAWPGLWLSGQASVSLLIVLSSLFLLASCTLICYGRVFTLACLSSSQFPNRTSTTHEGKAHTCWSQVPLLAPCFSLSQAVLRHVYDKNVIYCKFTAFETEPVSSTAWIYRCEKTQYRSKCCYKNDI